MKKNATCRVQPAPSVFSLPQEGERPVVYADRVGECYVERKSDEHRKNHGLYLTPVAAADFMAGLIKVSGPKLRILDPAAGAGILCCAAIEALVSRDSKPDIIELVVHEVDRDLIAPLHAVLDYLVDWCCGHGVTVAVQVEETDFIMAHAETLRSLGELFPYRSVAEDFDIVIANPPYFKISKTEPARERCFHRGSRPAKHLCALHGGQCRTTARKWGLRIHHPPKFCVRPLLPAIQERFL